jgi:hypothetical protein
MQHNLHEVLTWVSGAVQNLIDTDARAGNLYRPALSWEDACNDAKALSEIYTKNFCCRSLDILHCAIAGKLGIKTL